MRTALVPPPARTAPDPAPDVRRLPPPRPDRLAVLGVPGQINLDYAASAPCARVAADAVAELLPWYASVHRGAGALSRRCSLAYESARQRVGDFLGARPGDHVIFTRNTTDALNLLARALPPDASVVTFASEHHANLLPWPDRTVRLPVPESPGGAVRALDAALRELRRPARGRRAEAAAGRDRTIGGVTDEPVPAGPGPGGPAGPGPGGPVAPGPGGQGTHGLDRPVLVAVTGAGNVTGERWPVAELALVAHRHGARLALDAAQLAPHAPVDIAALGLDYVAVSGHKLYAPFGAGALVGRGDWLDAAAPYLAGGGATSRVGAATHDVHWATGPGRHEAGTPNLLGAVALAAVCDALDGPDRAGAYAAEQALLARLRTGLADLPKVVELRMFDAAAPRVGIVSFVVAGRDSATVAAELAGEGIGVRDGLFCAHPLSRRLLTEAATRSGRSDLPPTAVRASIGLGSTTQHVDRLLAALARIR